MSTATHNTSEDILASNVGIQGTDDDSGNETVERRRQVLFRTKLVAIKNLHKSKGGLLHPWLK